MPDELNLLVETVQHNCHIADARHAADYGLCTYLMKMREYYRWEHGFPYGQSLDKDRVGDWLTHREALWERISGADFRPLPLGGQTFDPFAVEQLNELLLPSGRVYSAGLGQGGRPQFFLAELENTAPAGVAGFRTHVSGRELARGLSAAPAMTLGRDIFVRRASLRQFLWEKYEAWLWNRPDNAYARVLGEYRLETSLEAELERMTAAEIPVLTAHELGESRAGQQLGPQWEEMLLDLLYTPAELVARAARDNLADALETLQLLLRPGREASLHLYIAALSNMRRQLWPGLLAAYADFLESGDRRGLASATDLGRTHWAGVGQALLALHAEQPDQGAARIAARVESYRI